MKISVVAKNGKRKVILTFNANGNDKSSEALDKVLKIKSA